jgi:hypothetical protein
MKTVDMTTAEWKGQTVKRGDVAIHPAGGTVRVLAIVDNYVVMRRKGCTPFLEHINNFFQRYKSA